MHNRSSIVMILNEYCYMYDVISDRLVKARCHIRISWKDKVNRAKATTYPSNLYVFTFHTTLYNVAVKQHNVQSLLIKHNVGDD